MAAAMEFHDSYLNAWGCDAEGNGFALIRATIHRYEGEKFAETNHESGWQELRFSFKGMTFEGEVDFAEDTWIQDGSITISGKKDDDGLIYLPAEHIGDIQIQMDVSPTFDTVTIRASELKTEFLNEFEHERFWNEAGNPLPYSGAE